MPADDVGASTYIAVRDLPVETVRYWYAAPEPVYLVVYLESVDGFFAEDVRDIVDRQGGPGWLSSLTGQRTTTLKVSADAALDQAISRMPRHRSMRIDGPPFRGRPLGHRYDPLRSELDRMEPDDFEDLVNALLQAHDYRKTSVLDLQAELEQGVGRVRAHTGVLYLTYEWTNPLFTEFGTDPGTDFRIESRPEYAHGEVAVVIHADPQLPPSARLDAVVGLLQARGTARVLVFMNASELGAPIYVGGWRQALEPLVGFPQGLGSLAFNVLTASSVYVEFADRLRWKHVNYLWGDRSMGTGREAPR
jgi:hypothetical protein